MGFSLMPRLELKPAGQFLWNRRAFVIKGRGEPLLPLPAVSGVAKVGWGVRASLPGSPVFESAPLRRNLHTLLCCFGWRAVFLFWLYFLLNN